MTFNGGKVCIWLSTMRTANAAFVGDGTVDLSYQKSGEAF